MAPSKDNQAKATKTAGKKSAGKRIRKTPNPNQKRGQPTAAARLISSPYIKFGWHKPLSGEVKESVQRVSSMADSMYMLQIERDRPIESLSLRNGLFWEQRQLVNEMVSTPAVDHIDLFPHDEAVFQDTLLKIGKRPLVEDVDDDDDDDDYSGGLTLHYMFSKMRRREFLLLPVEIDGNWVTIIARMGRKSDLDSSNPEAYVDREVTDLTIVDPMPQGREHRRDLVHRRLISILAEGCIELSAGVTMRNLAVGDIPSDFPDCQWKSGLIAYAVSREFLRRLKTLQWRRDHGSPSDTDEFLWAPFEEDYNFAAYRQNLMAACAYQCIEMSGYQVRMALEVPSEDSNYDPKNLRHVRSSPIESDEKWEVFQSPTHTVPLIIGEHDHPLSDNAEARRQEMARALPPAGSPPTPSFSPGSPEINMDSVYNAPVAPMGEHELSIPGLSLVGSPDSQAAEMSALIPPDENPMFVAATPTGDLSSPATPSGNAEFMKQETSLKRRSYDDEDEDEDEEPSQKRVKTD
ncbi:hypothetical protein F4825DRAFT_80851 [Nemania diffusa]|nr:hypothetical protein F4825DRAFT_80851 [Nemania diffusa]